MKDTFADLSHLRCLFQCFSGRKGPVLLPFLRPTAALNPLRASERAHGQERGRSMHAGLSTGVTDFTQEAILMIAMVALASLSCAEFEQRAHGKRSAMKFTACLNPTIGKALIHRIRTSSRSLASL
jgi:hypothetical protein